MAAGVVDAGFLHIPFQVASGLAMGYSDMERLGRRFIQQGLNL